MRLARPRSRRLRRLIAVLAVGVVASTIASGAAPPSGAQGAAPAPPPPKCTYTRSGAPGDEWGSCLKVDASFDHVPAVGQTATLRVTVRSQAVRNGAQVRLDLPSGVNFVSASDASLSTERARSGVGAVRRATASADLSAGSTRTFSYQIRPAKTGAVHAYISVKTDGSGTAMDGAEKDLFFTVGKTAAGSHMGAAPAPANGITAPVPAGARLSTNMKSSGQRILAGGVGAVHSDDPSHGQSAPGGQGCVTGGWFYVDNNGVTRPAINETVQVWDHDDASGDDQLAFGVIGFDGRYSFCFSSDDGLFDSTQEVYIRFVTTNTRWRVRNDQTSDQDYAFRSGTFDVCDGCDRDYGNLQPGNNAVMPGLHAFDELGDLWRFVAGGSQNCFDRNDTSCRVMTANWSTTATEGTDYLNNANYIRLLPGAPNSQFTVVHEGSHALMDDAYEDDMPFGNCASHDIPVAANAVCAWVEGFAEWLPAQVYNNPIYQYPDGTIRNLETPTWNTAGWANGDQVEGRIAGTLIDITDNSNEDFWDVTSNGFASIYNTFINNVTDTLNEFLLTDRVNSGFEFADAGSRASTYQNTIDYDFRDPLTTRAERVRPTPVPTHNYGFSTSSNFWSVVGTRQAGDYDLNVYDNRNLTGLLGSSTAGGNTMDFVAIDGNRRASGDYYPRVSQFNGATGNYGVEYVQGAQTVPDGTHSVFYIAGDVLNVEDTFMTAGVPTVFRVVPTAGLDVDVFLMRSDSANAGTQVQGRSSAVRSSAIGGAGVAEAFSFTETASQWDGLVVTNKSGTQGTYTVYRDTTAPTSSSVAINIGAAKTNTRNVTAFLSSTDSQTGLYQMRVAFDGTLDTEPWIPYSTSLAGSLTAGNGTKTVAVQFRNNALMVSPIVTDTIVLDQRPNLVITGVSRAPASARRGTAFNVADVTRNSGPTPTGVGTNTRYYLSTDKTKSGNDIQLTGARAVPALAANTSNTGSRSVTIPGATAVGQYWIITCADAGNAVAEYSETDNCAVSATRVQVTT